MGGAAADDGSQIAVGRGLKVGRVADSSTKFDGFKWVRVVEGDELSDQIRPLGFEPKMK